MGGEEKSERTFTKNHMYFVVWKYTGLHTDDIKQSQGIFGAIFDNTTNLFNELYWKIILYLIIKFSVTYFFEFVTTHFQAVF